MSTSMPDFHARLHFMRILKRILKYSIVRKLDYEGMLNDIYF